MVVADFVIQLPEDAEAKAGQAEVLQVLFTVQPVIALSWKLDLIAPVNRNMGRLVVRNITSTLVLWIRSKAK